MIGRFIPSDLAPGDLRAADADWSALQLHFVRTRSDPAFKQAYHYLWEEFGGRNEVESESVLERRLSWSSARSDGDFGMYYELVEVLTHGQFAAVRDHTAIVDLRPGSEQVVVHLSHVLVHPLWRRTGLAGFMRALPVEAARIALRDAGLPLNRPITLAAEMEPWNPEDPPTLIRLKAYEKAGFVKVDPAVCRYLQPDFRPPEIIDSSGGPRPLELRLLLRRVGREFQEFTTGREVRAVVEALYAMYAREFRDSEMAAPRASLQNFPADDEKIALLPAGEPE